MAKRLTDTDKWKKPFIRSLPVEYKIFWLYIIDDCDHAGIWHVDIEVAQIRLGIKLSIEKARGLFGERVVEFDGGAKWFVPDFIHFQYGSLTEKNKMYNSVFSQLGKYSLMGHLSPIYGGKDKDTVKDKDKEKVLFGKSENLLNGSEVKNRIEDCLLIALSDLRWVKANKATQAELENFNRYLEKLSTYEKNPLDYKQYFAKLKGRYPEMLVKELSMDELRQIAREMDKQNSTV